MPLEKNINWATNDNFPAGANPWSATPNKTEPSAQLKAEGFKPEQPVPSNIVNWLLNRYGIELERLSQIVEVPSMDFSTTVGGGLKRGLIYNKILKRYFVFGDDIQYSDDQISFNTLITSSPNILDACVSDNGQTFFCHTGSATYPDGPGTVFILNYPLWNDATVLPVLLDFRPLGTETVLGSSLCYDPVSNKVCWLARISTPAFLVSTATPAAAGVGVDGGVNHSTVSPFIFDTAKALYVMKTNGKGRILVALSGSGDNTTKTAFSDDGGVTWSAGGNLTHAFTVPNTGLLSLDVKDDGSEFTVSVGTSGNSEVWVSTDGAAWIKKATLTDHTIRSIVSYGSGWIANALRVSSSQGGIIFSQDRGATWYEIPGTFVASASGFFVQTAGRAYQIQLLSGSTWVLFRTRILRRSDLVLAT